MRWRGFLNAAFGVWLISGPLTFGTKSPELFWSDIICGLIAIIFGLLTVHFRLLAWITAMIGVWLQMAPLIFWAPEASTYLNDTFIGLMFLIFSIVIPDTPGAPESKGAEVPPGWSFNPSSYLQRTPIIFFNLICWLISRYLGAYQLGYIDHVWDPFFTPGTVAVLTSDVSKSFPVPDAALGATAYLLEAIFAFGDTRRWHTMPWFVLMFGILAVPVTCVSVILVILQPTIVGAWCTLCLFNACMMLFIVPFAIDEVFATLQFMKHAKDRGESFWKTFWGGTAVIPGPADPRVPDYNASYIKLCDAMRWGITFPWNLALTAALGIGAMFIGAFIPGALITFFSVLSCSEVIRKLRFVIIPLGAWLAFMNPLLGIAAIALCLRKGPIREKYGAYTP